MALINCKYCGEEVSDRCSYCIHCGGKLKDNDDLDNSFAMDINKNINKDNPNGIEKNINYFLRLANILKVIFIIVSIILIIGGIAACFDGDDEVFAYLFCFSIVSLLIAILGTPVVKWKGYVLKELYEINKKIRK